MFHTRPVKKYLVALARLCARSCALLFLIAIAGCDLGPNNRERGLQEQVLHVGNGTEPQDLDPHTVTGVPEHNIISALLEGLVAEHPKTLAPQPGIAASWQIDQEGKRYTFTLRDTARWSNGDKVTAHDFVWSWQRLLTPALGAEYAYQLYPIVNARRFHRGDITQFEQVGVAALDEKTLQVTLENPVPYFLSLLAHYSTFAVHPPTILAHGAIGERGTRWTRAGNYVGNGPFALAHWRLNHLISVDKNRHYWDARSVRLKGIRFYPVSNVTTEERMFRTGALHLSNSIPVDKIARYRREQAAELQMAPYLGTYFYRLNTTRAPLNDQRVRRALSLSIDRAILVEKITQGGQLPAYALTPPDTQGYYPPDQDPQYDTALARQLLAVAGYPNGEGFPALELLYNTSEGHRRIAVAIQQMWKQVLNIDIDLFNLDWKVFLTRSKSLDYDIARASWIGDYPDPNTFLDMMVTDGGNNGTGWSSPVYDALIADAARTLDRDKRYATFSRAEEILSQQSPLIPIYTYTRNYLKHTEVQGWYDNILDHHPYKYVYLERPASTETTSGKATR